MREHPSRDLSGAFFYDARVPDLKNGDPMPATTLVDGDGKSIQLRDHIGKPLVVYFYPADDTYGCTREACSFRDAYTDFTAAGAEAIGISADDEGSHAKFKSKHQLPFTLLSDPGGTVADAWNVKKLFGIAGRVTFVFDKDGIVRHKFNSVIRFGKHVEEALAVIQQLPR